MSIVVGHQVEDLAWLSVTEPAAVGALRRRAGNAATSAGFDPQRVADVELAVTEAATNLDRHGVDGAMALQTIRGVDTAGVRLIATDRGPGIDDVAMARVDGASSRGTLGLGLGTIERLASQLDLYSLPGSGTVLVATFWPSGATGMAVPGTITRPITGEDSCGDAIAYRWADGRLQVLVADGLGHGPLAAIAAQLAVRIFAEAPEQGPAATLEWIHGRLGGTRGVAAAISELDPEVARLRFAGLGNIAGWIDDGERRRGMTSHPGIVGHQMRRITQFEYEFAKGSLVVMHSDGLTDKWDLRTYPGIRARDPVVIAARLLRDAGIRHDDASIVVLRAG